MGNSNGSFKSIKDKMSKENIILVLIILSPLILTIIFSIIGDIDARKTQERLNNRPTTTWRDILTPEERKKMGLDRYEEMEQNLKSGSTRQFTRKNIGSSKSGIDFDKEDYYDIVDYYDGLDGDFSDIDYNDITDIHAD